MVRAAVLLCDAEFGEEHFESVGTAAESCGEHESVVSQGGLRDAVQGAGALEGLDHDVAGDSGVGGDRDQVAGVVVEEDQYFGVGAVGEPDVGEVGLPALVG